MKYYVKYRPNFKKCRVDSFLERNNFKRFVALCLFDGRYISSWSVDADGNIHDYSIDELRSLISFLLSEVFYE